MANARIYKLGQGIYNSGMVNAVCLRYADTRYIRFVQDGEFSWTVNSCGHFLMVITNGGNAGAGAKPLLGSANTVQCQVRGCGSEAPAWISEHCSVSGLG